MTEPGGRAARIRLWHAAQSRSFRVLWFLHEAGLPFEMERISFLGKALRDETHLARSPAGRVPAAEIDGRTMFESGAIIEYLCETQAPDLGRPPGHPERAEWLEWLHYAETIGQHLAQLTQQHVVLREDWMRSPTVMRLEAMRLARALGGMCARKEGRPWLLPSGFSAVDIAVGYGVHLAGRFLHRDEVPGLASYHARLVERPGFRAALADDGTAEIYLRDFYEVPDG